MRAIFLVGLILSTVVAVWMIRMLEQDQGTTARVTLWTWLILPGPAAYFMQSHGGMLTWLTFPFLIVVSSSVAILLAGLLRGWWSGRQVVLPIVLLIPYTVTLAWLAARLLPHLEPNWRAWH